MSEGEKVIRNDVGLLDAENIIEYIASNYKGSRKIVEIGVGRVHQIALGLREKLPETEIVVTDIEPNNLKQIPHSHGLKTVVDDITAPRMGIYANSTLIYSIRPPPELHPHLLELAKKVQADLIIRLLTNEPLYIHHTTHKIINYKKTVLHLFKFRDIKENR